PILQAPARSGARKIHLSRRFSPPGSLPGRLGNRSFARKASVVRLPAISRIARAAGDCVDPRGGDDFARARRAGRALGHSLGYRPRGARGEPATPFRAQGELHRAWASDCGNGVSTLRNGRRNALDAKDAIRGDAPDSLFEGTTYPAHDADDRDRPGLARLGG